MTKAEIVEKIVKKTGLSKEEVLPCVEGFMSAIKTSLANEEDVFLRGFGTFLVKTRKEKKARNIKAGTTVIVPEHNIPAFKPCDDFMEEVATKCKVSK